MQLDQEQNKRDNADPPVPDSEDLDDVARTAHLSDRPLTDQQQKWLASSKLRRIVEGWIVGPDGRGQWVPVDDVTPELAAGEEELPMWQRPPRPDVCALARPRSLWFGLVPTLSAAMDAAGRPRFDERSVYSIRTFARRPLPPGHKHCPPTTWWSEPTVRYRRAPFFDPAGTKNRRVAITMPDFRALSARAGSPVAPPTAGRPVGPGGVEIIQPPGSQLRFQVDPDNARAVAVDDSTTNLGADISRSVFAVELFTIVAMFVFSLFLPIVVLLFQLWWLLLLRFTWPPPTLALDLLGRHMDAAGNTIANLPAKAPRTDGVPTGPGKDLLDEVLGVQGVTNEMPGPLTGSHDAGGDLVNAIDPDEAGTIAAPVPEDLPADPLCPAHPAASLDPTRTP